MLKWPGLVVDVLERLSDFCLDFIAELGIVCNQLLGGLSALGKFLVAVAEP